MSTVTQPRIMVIWCPDWPVAAAGIEAGLGNAAPIAVFHANHVAACNAAARREGVRRGMRRRDAQSRCPELAVCAHQPERDARFFEPIVTVVAELIPRVAVLRPGLLAAAVPTSFYGSEEQAAAIMAEKLVQCGVWDVRIGIADEIFTAEQAARQAATQEHLIVPPQGSSAFLGELPIHVLTHDTTGEGAAARELADLLHRLGLQTLAEYAAWPIDAVVNRCGPYGITLHRLLHGQRAQPLAARAIAPERSCEVHFEPGVASIETVCFSVRQTVERFVSDLAADQQVCTMVGIEIETDSGMVTTRSWASMGWFGATDLVDRVHWQLQGAARAGELDAPIVRVHFTPEVVEATAAHAEALWGTGTDERVARGIAKVQSMVGFEAVVRPVKQGGRTPMDRQAWVPWGERAVGLRPVGLPWPGSIPAPAPSRVFPEPFPAVINDGAGRLVRFTSRGALTGEPARFRCAGVGATAAGLHIAAWAGPWPVDERWWADGASGLVARCQIVDIHGRAWLVRYADKDGWCTEASYD